MIIDPLEGKDSIWDLSTDALSKLWRDLNILETKIIRLESENLFTLIAAKRENRPQSLRINSSASKISMCTKKVEKFFRTKSRLLSERSKALDKIFQQPFLTDCSYIGI